MDDRKPLRPLSWRPSVLAFLAVTAGIYLAQNVFAPAYHAATGQPYLIGYLIAWLVNMATVFLAALLAYRWEGRPFTWKALAARFRLARMPGRDWLWALAVLVVAAGASVLLQPTVQWLTSIPLVSARAAAVPPDLGPEALSRFTPGVLFEMPLKGQWWIVVVYFVGWVLNILGEEFWYRGWMLPRQELAFGKHAWVVNAGMFTFQHIFMPWNYLVILPGALFAVYAVQRRRNTWLTIFQHGLMNAGLLLVILWGVIG